MLKISFQGPADSHFVFTLDCNNRIYCYDTDDETPNSRLADARSSLKCAIVATVVAAGRLKLTASRLANFWGGVFAPPLAVDCTCTGSLL